MNEPADLTGLQIGVYVVQAPLGAGGMAVVYRAVDTKLNRPVAIKFLADGAKPSSSSPAWPMRSPPRTTPASFTATSSRKTF